MKTILIVTMTLWLALTPGPTPHEFEDGFVERTLSIVIRDNVATGEYSIGLNETTLNELLNHWQKSEQSSELPEQPAAGNADHANSLQAPTASNVSDSDTEVGSLIDPKSDLDAKAAEPNLELESKPLDDAEKRSPQRSPQEPTDPASTKSDNQVKPLEKQPGKPSKKISEPENFIHQRLLEKLKSAGPNQIAERISVTCDGKPLEIKNVEASPAPRHPFVLVVKFEFEIPPAESAQLSIVDQNFRQQTGAVRYALKVLGSTMLVKSTAAPIIIRSKRVELASLSEKERLRETSISARILLMSNSEEDE